MTKLNHTYIEYALNKLTYKLKQQGFYPKQITITDTPNDDKLEWVIIEKKEETNDTNDSN